MRTKNICVGVAIDVSASMKGNMGDSDKNRFQSVRQSLIKFSKGNITSNIDVFAYVYGTICNPLYLDFLSLLDLISSSKRNIKGVSIKFPGQPYAELSNIARQYGIEDLESYEKWLKESLNITEAENLCKRLYQLPFIAQQIASYIPRNWGEAKKKVEDKVKEAATLSTTEMFLYGFGTVGLGILAPVTLPFMAVAAGARMVGSVGHAGYGAIQEEKANLEKARVFAKEIAIATDEEINNILVKKFSENPRDITMKFSSAATLLENFENENKGNENEFVYKNIFGNTPMVAVLTEINNRFDREKFNQYDQRILFIFSDGQPTDGDPTSIVKILKEKNICVVACFISSQQIESMCLFDKPQSSWCSGAKLMFELSSPLPDRMVNPLKERMKWTVPKESKLFVQLNHPDLLDQFVSVVLKLNSE